MHRKRWRIGGRFYAVAAALAVLMGAVIWMLATQQDKVVTIEKGVLAESDATEALVLRSEQVIPSENYGKVVFTAAEGERVKQGDQVAIVYKQGYSDKQLQDLDLLNKQILDHQQELISDIVNQDLQAIDREIGELTAQVATAKEDGTNLVLLQRQLSTKLDERSATLKDSLQPDSELTSLYKQQSDLEEKLKSWQNVVLSPSGGIVSFYLDGYERQLTLNELEDYTPEDALKLMQEAEPDENLDSRIYKSLYRLVNPNQWFLAIQGSKQTFVEGSSYEIALPEVSDDVHTGRVALDLGEGKNRVVLLVVDEPIGSVLSLRNVKATAGKTYEGLKVPEGALRKVDGEWNVYLASDKDPTAVPVTVVVRNDGYAIVEETGKGGQLKEGTRILSR